MCMWLVFVVKVRRLKFSFWPLFMFLRTREKWETNSIIYQVCEEFISDISVPKLSSEYCANGRVFFVLLLFIITVCVSDIAKFISVVCLEAYLLLLNPVYWLADQSVSTLRS